MRALALLVLAAIPLAGCATHTIDAASVRGHEEFLAGDALNPEQKARGVTWQRVPEPFTTFFYFNLRDPVLGGMDPAFARPMHRLRRSSSLHLMETPRHFLVR